MTPSSLTALRDMPWQWRACPVLFATLILLLSGPLAAASADAQTLPAQSFEELRTTLRVGNKLIIRDADGRTTKGRLSVLTGAQIEVESRRWFRSRKRTFSESAVRRVQIEDGVWKGALLGLAIGGAFTGVVCSVDDEGYGCFYALLLAPTFGAGLGSAVDGFINRSVYETPRPARTTLSPVVGPGRLGLAARVRF